ncbi:cupin domain-containing protein [Solimonas sp. K1W22B-7]|uniref:cupin domain-containing protein n=1 Tax=Solimonas sp. K1W22B-7 TaxID=2303331 RepID=UPI000E337CE1|nr:cupin domain-containing protein [Solimonas sp. K1W22B-7]AXQ27398.1 cupin domain-containing protein [Solimonas sp. K1W22B-7]
MKRLAGLLLAAVACAAVAGPAGVTIVDPASLSWRSEPAAPGAAVAVVSGDPKAAGPYVIRARFTQGARSAPHRHPDTRTITVLQGRYFFATGTRFDEAALRGYGPGTLLRVPGDTPHFSAAPEGEVIVQESGDGPTALERVAP